MRTLGGCSMIVALLLSGWTPVFGAEAPDELAALQGTWKGTEAGQEENGTCTLKIEGNSIYFQGSNKNEWYKGTFKLLSDKKPKQIHGTVTECPYPEFEGKTALAVYRIKDGTLTFVGRRPGDPTVPSGFEDTKARRFVLKKVL